ARPGTVVLTTPNAEYNALFPGLAAGKFRHHDHRFEWAAAAWKGRKGPEGPDGLETEAGRAEARERQAFMLYALVFAILACLLACYALVLGGWAWLLLWLALGCAWVSAGYAGLGAGVFGKQADGRRSWWAWLAATPPPGALVLAAQSGT